ncbi:BsuPI-related putative proteinase inhibitor [Halobacillus campisalis]|uniref:Intracellular proteinase inhibitor BsuPI domain-containing protein n=1 Tax=Halobacillus campisalis TaxID=435909 RepID=A0ABW2K4Z4_9BACI|nr:BsuPI-related putative proteinase inhibitor [Halobacillus campisalis]
MACSNSDDASESETDNNNETEETSNSESEEPSDNIVALIEQLTFEAEVVQGKDGIMAEFSITNDAEEPVILGFNSSLKYDVIVENQDGEEVYKYSEGQAFTQQLTMEELEPGEKLEANETVNEELPPGDYNVTMTFLVTSINDQPFESKPFEISKQTTIGQGGETSSGSEEAEELDEELETSQGDNEEAFRDLTLEGENGSYTVSGEVNAIDGQFFYMVEDGHNLLIEEEAVQVEDPGAEWSSFKTEVTIPEEDLPNRGALIMTMFNKDEEGQPTQMNFVPLDNFDAQ